MLVSTWNIDASQILSRQELAAVLKDLKRRARRLPNVQMNLAIVRLACCCGLRASEIGGLSLGDVRVGIARPHLLVRAEHAKLNRPRRVPLWWDAGGPLGVARPPARPGRQARRPVRLFALDRHVGAAAKPPRASAPVPYGRPDLGLGTPPITGLQCGRG